MDSIKRLPPWTFLLAGGALILGYLVFTASVLIGGYRAAARGEMPVFTDFTPKYAVSMLVQREPAANLYIPERMFQANVAAAQAAYGGRLSDRQAHSIGFAPWMYPPFFILFLYPLAFLPYLGAVAAWLAVTAIPYGLAMARALGRRAGLLLAFASPPAFYNLMFGQTGFLSGGLIGLGLSLVHARPVAAGICIGLATFKPHLGILVPFALVAGEHWKPFGIAAITLVALVVASVQAFGMDPWYGLIGTIEFYRSGFEAGAYSYEDLVTVQGMLRLAGAGPDIAWKVQMVAAAGALAAVVWAWWHKRSQPSHVGLQTAVLGAATLLAVPMAYSYDLVLLMPGVAWLWADMRERGASLAEVLALALPLAAILPLKAIAGAIHFQYAPLVSLALLVLAVVRLNGLRRQAASGTGEEAGSVAAAS